MLLIKITTIIVLVINHYQESHGYIACLTIVSSQSIISNCIATTVA